LQEREQQIGEQLTAAREQAEQLQANAARAAERLREESEEAAEQTRQRADADARRRLDEAGKEIARLSGLEADVRSELAQLAQLISAELASAQAAQGGAREAAAAPPEIAKVSQNSPPNGGRSRDRK
jgi:hypothetical protein